MALPSSGPISMSMVNTELGISPSTTQISLNDSAVRTLFQKTTAGSAIAMSDGWGKSNFTAQPTSITVTEIGAYSLTVNWTENTGGTHYRVRIYTQATGGTAIYDSGEGSQYSQYSPIQFSGTDTTMFTPATSYTLYVCYVNTSGVEGPRVASSSITTKTVKATSTGGTIYYWNTLATVIFTSTANFTLTSRDQSNLSLKYALIGGGYAGGDGGEGGYDCGGTGGDGGSSGQRKTVTNDSLDNLTVNTAYQVAIGASEGYGTSWRSVSSTAAGNEQAPGGYGGGGSCGESQGPCSGGTAGDYLTGDSNLTGIGSPYSENYGINYFQGGQGGGGGGSDKPGDEAPGCGGASGGQAPPGYGGMGGAGGLGTHTGTSAGQAGEAGGSGKAIIVYTYCA